MVYRRTHQVVKRLAARRSAILAAARDAASEGGMAAPKGVYWRDRYIEYESANAGPWSRHQFSLVRM